MSEIKVPEFLRIEDFQEWARGLSNKEVQSWSTKDWNKMFDGLYDFVEKNADLDMWCRDKGNITSFIQKHGIKISAEDLLNPDNINGYKRLIFMDKAGKELGQLYSNYKFEQKQFDIIRQTARLAGESTVRLNAAELFIRGFDISSDKLQFAAEQLDKAVLFSAKTLTAPSQIKIQKSLNGRAGENYAGKNYSKMNLARPADDSFLRTVYHESAHAHLQANAGVQQAGLKSGIVPIQELGEDFYKLQKANHDFYYLPEDAIKRCTYIAALEQGSEELGLELDKKVLRDTKRRIWNNYHRQPIEKFSEVFGIETERVYRRTTGQVSERGAMRIAEYLHANAKCGAPMDCWSNGSGVTLKYSPSQITAERIEELTKGLSEETIAKMKPRMDKAGNMLFDVPSNYSFMKTVERELFLTPSAWTAAVSAEGAMEATAAARFEEKAALKAGSTVAKTVTDEAAKKSGVLAKAAEANAKFDKAVDKTIEKGAEALNNSAVGKVYEKAATKVGETKAAQMVTKATEKVVEKAAETAAGKMVTKAVVKTAGSAVGKSVLKKIPVVSLGAGAYFAWERIKNGEWKAGACEVLSGAAGCFPGLGTAASAAIDVGLATSDVYQVLSSAETAGTSAGLCETATAGDNVASAQTDVSGRLKADMAKDAKLSGAKYSATASVLRSSAEENKPSPQKADEMQKTETPAIEHSASEAPWLLAAGKKIDAKVKE